MKHSGTPHELGRLGEEIALQYLQSKGYRIAEKGFRLPIGEIDIIAYDKDTLVFVEVKARMQTGLGLPEESVTPKKQEQIRKVASGYLARHDLEDVACRFDVISLTFNDTGSHTLSHLVDAF
ncbi:MAG: YraN family protein [Candidatus Aminicenantales bacterium]